MNRSLVLSLGVLAMVVMGGAIPTATAADKSTGMALQQDVDPDLVTLNVEIQSNGDAEWTIEYLVRLRDENETRAFEDLQADVETNTSDYIERFADRMNSTVADAETATGREMTATDFEVSAEISTLGTRYGVLTYSFTWANFAAVSGDTITAGDALEGFFLDEDTTLQFRWSEDHALASVAPEPSSTRDQTVVWQGPLDFATGEPTLTLEPAPADTTTTTIDGETTQATTTPSEESTAIWMWLLGGIFVLAVIGVAAWYWREEPSGTAPTDDGGDEPPPSADLLSNEERVEQFLESQGGRSKQQEIVEGLGWTEAKTSQVLSDMQESGRIEKFRIGRENVVKLPDTDGESE